MYEWEMRRKKETIKMQSHCSDFPLIVRLFVKFVDIIGIEQAAKTEKRKTLTVDF